MDAMELFDAHRDIAIRAVQLACRLRRVIDAQDVAAAENAALLALWLAAQKFDPARNPHGAAGFGGYAMAACRRRIIDWLRREGPTFRRGGLRSDAVSLQEAERRLGHEIPDPRQEAALRRLDEQDAADALLQGLRPKERAVMLALSRGETQADAAAALGITDSYASRLFTSAKEFLMFRMGELPIKG